MALSKLVKLAMTSGTKQATKKSLPKSLTTKPKIKIDNPGYNEVYGETYAQTKQRYADAARQEALDAGQTVGSKAKIGSYEGVTTTISDVQLDPKKLADIPGIYGEEAFRMTGDAGEGYYNKLKALQEKIQTEGYKPDPKSPIQIVVREDGQPFVFEGNHRIAEAILSKRPSVNVEIQYLREGELVPGPLNPRNIIDEDLLPAYLKPETLPKKSGGRVERNPYGDYQKLI